MALSKSTARSKSTVKLPESKDDVNGWHTLATTQARADVDDNNERVEAHDGAWRWTQMCSGAWKAHGARDQWNRAFERRVQSPTTLRLSRVCRSVQDNLYGTFKTVIGAIFAAVMQRVVVCAVWNSLTTAAAGPEPKGDSWMTSEVQRRKAAATFVMAEAMLKKESH